LGVPEWSPRATLMNWGFYLQGALFLAGAVVAVRAVHRRRTGVALLLLTATNAVGNFLVGFVHGFSPLWNDGYEWLHGLGAFLAIGGGNAAVVVGSVVVGRAVSVRWYRPIGVMISAVVPTRMGTSDRRFLAPYQVAAIDINASRPVRPTIRRPVSTTRSRQRC
jgi:hypothetical protein